MKRLILLSLVAWFLGACDSETPTTPGDTMNVTVDTQAPEPDAVSPPSDATVPPADSTGPVDSGTEPTDTQSADTAISDTVTEDTAEPPDTGIVLPEEKPPIAKTYEMYIGDWDMQSGKETTRCVVKRLGNTEPIFVTGIKTSLAKGSHHLIVYKSIETEEQTEPFKCQPFTEGLSGGSFPLIISQIPEEHLQFPNGVAFEFEPNQMIRIEAHFLNYFPETITAHADVTFEAIAEEDVVAKADMLFYGTPDFSLPPNQETQTEWNFLDVLKDTHVFALTGHTHQWGTNVEVSYAKGPDDPGEPVYPLDQTFDWSESPVIKYDPPIKFAQGEGFKYRCTWFNGSNKKVGFGESAKDEMCFLWAYYYPSKGYRMCINAGSYGKAYDLDQVCCPDDDWICDLVNSFL